MMKHVGNIMSTSGSKTITQYERHLDPVQCMFNTSGEFHDACSGYHDACGGYHKYIGDVQYIEWI